MYVLTIPLAHLSINIVTITCDTLKGDPHHLSQCHQNQSFVGIALKSLLDENRLDSPDSFTFHVKDQGIDVSLKSARLAIATKPLTYADVLRFNFKTTSSDVSIEEKMSDARSPSPEIYSSDNEDPQELLRNWVNELRPHSPESIASQDEFRSLSPDSPVPQFIPHYCEYDVEYSANRSCSPVSAASDWDYNDLCLEYLFEEIRPDSPVSVLSDFELETFV